MESRRLEGTGVLQPRPGLKAGTEHPLYQFPGALHNIHLPSQKGEWLKNMWLMNGKRCMKVLGPTQNPVYDCHRPTVSGYPGVVGLGQGIGVWV